MRYHIKIRDFIKNICLKLSSIIFNLRLDIELSLAEEAVSVP